MLLFFSKLINSKRYAIIFILFFGKINVRRAEAQGRGFHQDISLKTINSDQSEIKICLMWVETVASFDQIQLRHFILHWLQAKLNNYYWIIGFEYYISGFLIGSANSGSSVSANRPNQLIWKLIPQALCVDESVAWTFNIMYIYIFGQA